MVAVMAMSTFAMAEDTSYDTSYTSVLDSVYVGIAYSYINVSLNNLDASWNSASILAGYELNEYFAIESRYSKNIDDVNFDVPGIITDLDFYNIGLYLKPMYTSGEVTLYGLLGGGHYELGRNNKDTLQWGAGISFNAGNSIFGTSDTSFFMDYIRFDEDGGDVLDSFNFGLAFKF